MTRSLAVFVVVSVMLFSFTRWHTPTSPANGSDTTSHNFSWRTFTLGADVDASVLSDVAIINDTLAYAVGAIYLRDSTTGRIDPQPYNLVRWNGHSWKFQKLSVGGFPPPIKSILAFSGQDMWLDPWFHWNGQSFEEIPRDPMFNGVGINGMWGDSGAIYVVGTGGFVARRNSAGVWTELSSGTTLDIDDIWGAMDPTIGKDRILAVASNPGENNGKMLLDINGNTITRVVEDSLLPWSINSVWFISQKKYFVVGDGIYDKTKLSDNTPWHIYPVGQFYRYYCQSVRGQALNDIVIVGDFGQIAHWNGATFCNYRGEVPHMLGGYGRVAIKGNLVIAVGFSSQQAVVTIGKRQ